MILLLPVLLAILAVRCSPLAGPDAKTLVSPPISLPVPTPRPKPQATPTPIPTPTPAPFIGEASFAPYLEQFLSDGRHYGLRFETINLRIRFDELAGFPSDTIGLCERGCVECPRVSLKSSWWDFQTELQKQMAADHEFGHCLLSRSHNSNVRDDGYPASIMNPIVLRPEVFLRTPDEYLRELFLTAPDVLSLPDVEVCEG